MLGKKFLASITGIGLAVSMVQGIPAFAGSPSELGAFDTALRVKGQEAAAVNPGVVLPRQGERSAYLGLVNGDRLAMVIPGSDGVETQDASTAILNDAESSVGVQSTSGGLRALVHIDSPDSPERYSFEMAGSVHSLELGGDGSALAKNAQGEI